MKRSGIEKAYKYYAETLKKLRTTHHLTRDIVGANTRRLSKRDFRRQLTKGETIKPYETSEGKGFKVRIDLIASRQLGLYTYQEAKNLKQMLLVYKIIKPKDFTIQELRNKYNAGVLKVLKELYDIQMSEADNPEDVHKFWTDYIFESK